MQVRRATGRESEARLEMSETLPFRVVRISFDEKPGEIVIEYGMPDGDRDVNRYRVKEFLEKADRIAKGIVFHVTP
jgi:hypothetical protein